MPLVEGLETQSVLVGEKLPVENEDVFGTMMGITRMVDKFEVIPNRCIQPHNAALAVLLGNIPRSLLDRIPSPREKLPG